MTFLETLRFVDVLRLGFARRPVFYGAKTLGARLAERLLARLGRQARTIRLDFGELEAATGVRGNAYRAAEAALERLPGRRWAQDLSGALGIDFWLIVQKYFFDEQYLRFEFVEMARRYAIEHRAEKHVLRLDEERLGAVPDGDLSQLFEIRRASKALLPGAAALILLPLFVEYYWFRWGRAGELRFDRQHVCEVESDKTLEMFSSLLQGNGRLAFVVEQRRAADLNTRDGIGVLGLRREGLAYLRRAVWRYLGACFRHRGELAGLGSRLFRIFYVLMQGRAETIEGSGNTYFTYEHFVTVKSVRNEFLRAAGNKTIFVPLNAHVTPQYFHSEILVNYDAMCAAGEHTEVLYRRKRTVTQLFLPTGSYECHRRSTRPETRAARLATLRAFKGDALAVTVVSPGIADATYGIERKLMRLARQLAAMPGIRVIVRMKPVVPVAKFARFYQEETAGCENILLTGPEYELFDFLDLSDLIVTSLSNAAFDLAQGGAQVMFIDFLRDPELQLCLSAIPGMLLPEETSLAQITEWIEDRDDARRRWRERMARFAAHIAYRHCDFESYRRNFLAQIAKAA